MHKCLECLDVSLAGILDTHLLFSPPSFVLYTRCCDQTLELRSRSTPGGAYYDVEIPDGQELIGGSQAGGLAFSIGVVFVLAFLRQTCTLCLYSDTIVSADLVLSS